MKWANNGTQQQQQQKLSKNIKILYAFDDIIYNKMRMAMTQNYKTQNKVKKNIYKQNIYIIRFGFSEKQHRQSK